MGFRGGSMIIPAISDFREDSDFSYPLKGH
jgi:hypothetical protein